MWFEQELRRVPSRSKLAEATRYALGLIDAQALDAGGQRLRARIVDADVAGEGKDLTPSP
jgi:hypothetical protein